MITDHKRDERYAKNMVLLISNILMLFLYEQPWHKQTFVLEHSPPIVRTRLSTRHKMNRFTPHRELFTGQLMPAKISTDLNDHLTSIFFPISEREKIH